MNSNPYSNLKFDPSSYDKTLKETTDKVNNIYDATIGQAANQSANAGAVAGVANTSRLSADTYGKIAENRDQKIYSATAGINQQKAASETAFNREKQFASAQWDAEQPNAFNYISMGASILPGLSQFGQSLGLFDKIFPNKGKANTGGGAFNYNTFGTANSTTTPGSNTFNNITAPSNVSDVVNQISNVDPTFGAGINVKPFNFTGVGNNSWGLQPYSMKKKSMFGIGN